MHQINLEPSKIPHLRLKLFPKGLLQKSWSVQDGNSKEELFVVHPTTKDVKVTFITGLTCSADLPSIPTSIYKEITYNPAYSDDVTKSKLNNRNKRMSWNLKNNFSLPELKKQNSVYGTDLNVRTVPKIALEIHTPFLININSTNRHPFEIEINGIKHEFEIRNINEFFQWRGWCIYKKDDIVDDSRPLVRFVWFEKSQSMASVPFNKKTRVTLGGVEFFAALPDLMVQAIMLVVSAFFTECHKEETYDHSSANTNGSPTDSDVSDPSSPTNKFFFEDQFTQDQISSKVVNNTLLKPSISRANSL